MLFFIGCSLPLLLYRLYDPAADFPTEECQKFGIVSKNWGVFFAGANDVKEAAVKVLKVPTQQIQV